MQLQRAQHSSRLSCVTVEQKVRRTMAPSGIEQRCWCGNRSSVRTGTLARHPGTDALKNGGTLMSAVSADSGECLRVAGPLAARQAGKEAAHPASGGFHLCPAAASTEETGEQKAAPQQSACTPAAAGPTGERFADEETGSSRTAGATEFPQLQQQQRQGDHVTVWNEEGRLQPQQARTRPLCVCMVSDFFYPSLGGIETHIYILSQCLLQRGYKVFVLTHFAAPNRHGVRYMLNGLKVYYLPFRPFVDNVTFPTFFSFFPLIRNILLRERADIVHGHQTTSTLAHETLMIARDLGFQVVYTDHSLFGFSDLASIHLNKIVRFCLHDMSACICVSHTHRENFVLRVGLPPSRVHVINNAIDPKSLYPDPSRRPPPPHIRIIVLSRLTYRKGIDLLVHVIPLTCKKLSHVQFVIGGDGPKRIILEEMREQHRLYDRVQLVGTVAGAGVRELLQSGHIFLNTSLTESFCIAIVEAAACGLLVVSTNVGGIPEVLPPHMVLLAEPDSLAVTKQVEEAVAVVHRVDPFSFHRQVQRMYSWQDVAARTERVYFSVLFPGLPYPPCCSTGKGTHGRGANVCACVPGCTCVHQQKRPLPYCLSPTSSGDSVGTTQLQDCSGSEGSVGDHCTPRERINRSGRRRSTGSLNLADDHSCASSGSRCSRRSYTGRERSWCRSSNSRYKVRQHCASSRRRGSSSDRAACEVGCGSAHTSSDGGCASSDSEGGRAASHDSDEEEKCFCVCCNRPPLCCGCLQLPPSPPPLPSASAVVQRLRNAYKLGPVSGKIFCIVIILNWIYIRVLEFFFPRDEIEEAPAFPSRLLLQVAHAYGRKKKRRGPAGQNWQRIVSTEACEAAGATLRDCAAIGDAAAAVDQPSFRVPGKGETR